MHLHATWSTNRQWSGQQPPIECTKKKLVSMGGPWKSCWWRGKVMKMSVIKLFTSWRWMENAVTAKPAEEGQLWRYSQPCISGTVEVIGCCWYWKYCQVCWRGTVLKILLIMPTWDSCNVGCHSVRLFVAMYVWKSLKYSPFGFLRCKSFGWLSNQLQRL